MTSPAHEGCAPNYITPSVLGNDLFTTEPVLCRNDRSFVEAMSDERHRLFHVRGFGCDDAKIAGRQLIRRGGRLDGDLKIVRARDPQSFPIERAGMFFTADESPYFRNPRQVRCVQTPDGPTANYAYPLHT